MTVVAEYNFSENLNDSAGTNHGVAQGSGLGYAESLVSSEPTGHSLSLGGSGWVRVPNSEALQLSGNYWLTAWVRSSELSGDHYAFCKGLDDYFIWIHNEQVRLGHRDSGGTYWTVQVETEMRVGRTYRIDVTFDGAKLRGFINGHQIGESAVTAKPRVTANAFYIGSESGSFGTYEGLIDKIRIRNNAGTAAEVLAEWITDSPTVYVEDFEGGNLDKWAAQQEVGTGASIEVVSSDPTPAEGTYALQAKVTSGESQRAEAVPGHVELFAGEEQYIRDRFYLTDPFPDDTWGAVIWQLRDAGNGSPIIAAVVIDGVLRIEGGPVGEPEVPQTTYFETPVETNRWYDLCVRVKGSEEAEGGLVQVWLDKAKQTMLVEKGRTAVGRAYHKFGLYRNPALTEQGIVTHDQIEITRALAFQEVAAGQVGMLVAG